MADATAKMTFSTIQDMQPGDSVQMDTTHVLTRWKDFAFQFAKENTVPVPATHAGIGRVNYNLHVVGTGGVNERSLRLLNECTGLEQYIGDNLMKFEAGLVSLITGEEVMAVKLAAGRRSPPPGPPPSAPQLPTVSVFPATATPPNYLSSSTSSTTYTTPTPTWPLASTPPTNTPIYLNPIIAAPPQNLNQLRAAPPSSKLQLSASLPNEFLLHITHGQGVPRRTLKRRRCGKGGRGRKKRISVRGRRLRLHHDGTPSINGRYGDGNICTFKESRIILLPLSPAGRVAIGRHNMRSNPHGLDAPQDFGLFTPGDEYDAAQFRDLSTLYS
ncbi:hypothetical protein G7Y89_g7858 [Cudoniella acicularis]|uniref:Uncharacterized protein n=1 Tax=Cudoniella acicularis TaxID=354080 RepID=A0A8H4RII2_9HELO|nr:hypothetical protein G7Y89_g7858 [Cudoniella acicularis]